MIIIQNLILLILKILDNHIYLFGNHKNISDVLMYFYKLSYRECLVSYVIMNVKREEGDMLKMMVRYSLHGSEKIIK
jgi:hypothetical protein